MKNTTTILKNVTLRKYYFHNNGETLIGWGIFLFSLASYILMSPGRIDIIDGQFRFDVALNLLTRGSFALEDPALFGLGVQGNNNLRFAPYGFSGSLIAIPLLLFAEFLCPDNRDVAQFFFAMTSPTMSAFTLCLLYKFYRELGSSYQSSLFWTLILGFTTLFFPLATSVFDQTQNSFFILASFYTAYIAQQRKCLFSATLSAISFIFLINFKEAYIVLWPGLLCTAGWDWLRSDKIIQIRKSGILKILILGGFLGIMWSIIFNWLRFTHPLPPLRPSHPPVLGIFPIGLLGLTVSPGKGILWYSPVVLLIILGWRNFLQKTPKLAQGILTSLKSWTLLIASLSFYGGDWCWGPRYWVPLLPIVFLAAPFIRWLNIQSRFLATLIIVISFSIQCLAVSVDHQRFYFIRGLDTYFWYNDWSFNFKHSALYSRLSEISEIEIPSQKNIINSFRPGPYPKSLTYTIFGPSSEELQHSREWIASYPVFNLPRPWPFWSMAIDDIQIEHFRRHAILLLSYICIAGITLISIGMILQKKLLLG
jgi:hypothetical protein